MKSANGLYNSLNLTNGACPINLVNGLLATTNFVHCTINI